MRALRLSVLFLPALLTGANAAPDRGDWLSLRRGPCFGNCPIYEVTLRADGTAEYHGGDYAPRGGEYEGRVQPEAVQALLGELDQAGFWEMARDRQLQVMDLPETVVQAERRGRRHRVHLNLTPRELEAVLAEIDSVVADIEWRPAREERRRPVAER